MDRGNAATWWSQKMWLSFEMGEEWKMAALEERIVSIASLVSMAGLVDGITETMPTRMVQNVDSILA
jgi:hypothetical protein